MLSLFSICTGRNTAQIASQMGTEAVLDYWSLRFQANGVAALGPIPPELGDVNCRPTATEAGLLLQ